MSRPPALFNCLIRTHHITSRKKLQKVRRAASQLSVDRVLVRSGGSPGLMYGESRDEAGLEQWVSAVQALRYKDFRCIAKPGPSPGVLNTKASKPEDTGVVNNTTTGFDETASIAEFAREMQARGLETWWKKSMGYEK